MVSAIGKRSQPGLSWKPIRSRTPVPPFSRNVQASMSSNPMMMPTEVARLIDRHAAPLVLCARQWCAEPEDVVQDAFIKLVQQPRPPADTVAWLYRVVRNGAIDAGKMARR